VLLIMEAVSLLVLSCSWVGSRSGCRVGRRFPLAGVSSMGEFPPPHHLDVTGISSSIPQASVSRGDRSVTRSQIADNAGNAAGWRHPGPRPAAGPVCQPPVSRRIRTVVVPAGVHLGFPDGDQIFPLRFPQRPDISPLGSRVVLAQASLLGRRWLRQGLAVATRSGVAGPCSAAVPAA
jgi:hypothetical protein